MCSAELPVAADRCRNLRSGHLEVPFGLPLRAFRAANLSLGGRIPRTSFDPAKFFSSGEEKSSVFCGGLWRFKQSRRTFFSPRIIRRFPAFLVVKSLEKRGSQNRLVDSCRPSAVRRVCLSHCPPITFGAKKCPLNSDVANPTGDTCVASLIAAKSSHCDRCRFPRLRTLVMFCVPFEFTSFFLGVPL